MPTRLGTKTVRRAVPAGGGELVVELTPDGLRIRKPRAKVAVFVSYETLFARGGDLSLDSEPARNVETRFYQLRASLTPDGVRYHEHGARKSFLLPHGVAYQRAVALAVSAAKAEKRGNKPTRRRRRAAAQ